jgi:hypothetical protein
MGVIKINGVTYGGGDNSVMLTQAEYDALVEAGTVDPTVLYMITDRNLGSTPYAAGVIYDNTDTGLTATNVQDAIDEVVGDVVSDLSDKMDKVNPTGTGTLSINRSPNTTIGDYSIAAGYNTIASGIGSHAGGRYTTANHASQHVFGEYNIPDPSSATATNRGNYVEIVGNGDYNTPSNARTLDWSGNETLSGNIEASGFGTTLLNLIYPVGSIYISVNNVNPGTYLTGTTWEAFGSGRTLVGVDTSDTDFDTVEETGGAKSHSYTPAGSNSGGSVGNTTLTAAQSGVPQHTHSVTTTANNTGAGNKLSYRLVWGAGNGHANNHVNGWDGGPGYSDFNDQAWPLQTHTHSIPALSGTAAKNTAANASQAHNHGFTNPTFTGTAATMSHMQPYITTYMWKRTA